MPTTVEGFVGHCLSPCMIILGSKGVSAQQFNFLGLATSLDQGSSLYIDLMIGSTASVMTEGPRQGRVLLSRMLETSGLQSQGVAYLLGFGKAWRSNLQVWRFFELAESIVW